MGISITDVAKQAGVSIATVSKVLNQTEGSRIGTATRERIMQVVATTGYQPSRVASALARRRSNMIGIMVSGLENPFFVMVMEALERRVTARGYQVMLDAAPATLGTYLEHGKIRGWAVDGVLMWAHKKEFASHYLGPVAHEVPVIYLGSQRGPEDEWAGFDYEAVGRLAVEHLVTRGYRRITFVTPHIASDGRPSEGRYWGCLAQACEHGADFDLWTIPDHRATREAAYQAGREIARSLAPGEGRAFVCHNDIIALGAIHGIRGAGRRVPEDAAVIGFDGIEEGRYQDIPLTTIEFDIDKMADVAVERLMALLAGEAKGRLGALAPYRLREGLTTRGRIR